MRYRTVGLAKFDKKTHKSYFSLLQTLHSYASVDSRKQSDLHHSYVKSNFSCLITAGEAEFYQQLITIVVWTDPQQ